MIEVTGGHLSIDLKHTNYRIVWKNPASNAALELRVQIKRPTGEHQEYLDYSELEAMHLALSDARIQFQKLINAADATTVAIPNAILSPDSMSGIPDKN